VEDNPWPWASDEKYVPYLEMERKRYAWVLRTYGDMPAGRADRAAAERYPYQPQAAPYRGLVFHTEAWHWAMITLKGELYWTRYPELERPPAEYNELC
jgi:hypothetical protein